MVRMRCDIATHVCIHVGRTACASSGDRYENEAQVAWRPATAYECRKKHSPATAANIGVAMRLRFGVLEMCNLRCVRLPDFGPHIFNWLYI